MLELQLTLDQDLTTVLCDNLLWDFTFPAPVT